MKKLSTFLFFFVIAVGFVTAQTIVTTLPQLKNAVLEEYTGIHCTYCPEGHAIAQQLIDDNPGRMVVINIHQGGYAVPTGTEPDFRTAFGDALAGQTGLTGYPTATVNRHVFPEIDAVNTAQGRGSWAYSAYQVIEQPSIVNLGFTSVFDTTSRELTVTVETYYVDNSSTTTNYLNVALLENHVLGPQTGGTPSVNYDHKHMLRHLITGQWGDTINTTTQGTVVSRTYTYTVPVGNVIENCDVAVFISETHQEIYTGVVAPAIDGSNTGETVSYIGDFDEATPSILHGAEADVSTFNFVANSALSGTEEFVFTLTSDAPNDWTSGFSINGTDYTTTATVNIENGIPLNIAANIIPSQAIAFAKYTLSMVSSTVPTAPARVMEFYVVAGITDLIVNGSGSWGDGEQYDFEQEYIDGLTFASCTSFATISAPIMAKAITQNAFEGINNVYLNVAWTFPSMSDDEATALMSFLDNGGNLFIAGQDMGWDIMSGDGYGTTITQNFYTNYLHAAYSADGSGTNNILSAVSTNLVFGTTPQSTIVDMYAGNIYPDQINPVGGAVAIFNYNNTATKVAGVAFNNDTYKVVYLGIGIEMLSDNAVKNQIVKTSYDWFYGLISNISDLSQSDVSVYPNPTNNMINIKFQDSKTYLTEILDVTGKVIYSSNNARNFVAFDMSKESSGLYFVKVISDNSSNIYKFNLVK